jgi:very-short-patch-repair endonuclease
VREERVEQRIARIAVVQFGVISANQLIDCGLSTSAISRWAFSGRLHRVHRGVYAVGHVALSLRGRWKAATLYCGEGSAISHRSGVELWRMLNPNGGPIHVTVASRGGRRPPPGLIIHRYPSLQDRDVTNLHGIPVTTPQRSLIDARRMLEPGELRQAVRQAEFLDLPIDARVVIPDETTSELELRFLALCRRHRLPLPEANVLVAGVRVDFLWRSARLVVETDGYAAHRGSVAFEEDRARDARLAALGYEVIRLTWRQVVHEQAATARLVRARLRARTTQSSR